jgi:hypothetical protein
MADIPPATPGRIFISYRREETAYPAGWLYDRLADRFGASKIFKDIDSIELGDDFVEVITTAVGACDVLLALIGNEWLTITGENGRRRLDDPADFVRVEIEAALARDVRVIPVLVDGASMPPAEDLPASLARLVRRHALELSPSRFDFDTGRLLRVLERTLGEVQAKVAATAPTAPVSTAPDEALARSPSTPPPLEHTGESPTPNVPPETRSSGWRRTLGKQLGRLSTRTRIVTLGGATVVLLLLIVAAVGNTNDSDGGSTAESNQGLAAYCDAQVAFENAALPPTVDFDSLSPEAQAEVWTDYANGLQPYLDTVASAAPDELTSDIDVLTSAVDELAATGDVDAVFGRPEVGAANGNVHAFDLANCGWTTQPVAVTEYAFDLPGELDTGVTSFELTNEGTELHQLQLLRKNDGVTETADELFALPNEEILAKATIVGYVDDVPPGETYYTVVDLEPGDYIAFCTIQVGMTSEDATPPDDAPPHFTLGEVSEFTVS